MATVMQTEVLRQLGLEEATLRGAMPHALKLIGQALSREPQPETGTALPAARVRKKRQS